MGSRQSSQALLNLPTPRLPTEDGTDGKYDIQNRLPLIFWKILLLSFNIWSYEHCFGFHPKRILFTLSLSNRYKFKGARVPGLHKYWERLQVPVWVLSWLMQLLGVAQPWGSSATQPAGQQSVQLTWAPGQFRRKYAASNKWWLPEKHRPTRFSTFSGPGRLGWWTNMGRKSRWTVPLIWKYCTVWVAL